MVSEEGFVRRVEELRQAGAKYIFLKRALIDLRIWLWLSPSLQNAGSIS